MRLSINAGAVYGDNLFFSDNSSNSLYRLDLMSLQLERIGEFPRESENFFLHRKCLIYGENLYFVPNMANNLHKYNVIEKKVESIGIERDCISRFNFSDAEIVNGSLWILPGNCDQRVAKIDLNSESVEYYSSYHNNDGKKYKTDKQLFWRSCFFDDKFLFALLGTNIIIEFNTLSNSWREIEIEPQNLYSIYNIDGVLYIMTFKGEVYIWDYKRTTMAKMNLPVDDKGDEAYIPIKITKDELYLIPCFGREILIKMGHNTYVKQNGLELENSKRINNVIRYENWTRWGNNAVLLPAFDDSIAVIKKGKIEIIGCDKFHDSYKNKVYELTRLMTNKDIMSEGVLCNLDDYLDGICRS